jgi:uncharacterized protein DUF3224
MTTLTTKLEIKSWDEKPYREFDDGRKFARAEVVLAGTDGGVLEGAFESLLYYAADGTSTFVSVLQLTAELDGRTGSVILTGDGGFDGTTATVRARVVEGTGALAGITGTLVSRSTHQDYPYMPITLTYELE